jgi:hypothetical protein
LVVVFGDDEERKEHFEMELEAYLCSFLDEESSMVALHSYHY